MAFIRKLLDDNRGVGAIEYALVASLISLAAITGYANLGTKVTSSFTNVSDALSNAL
jgi:Flp pilus assembly pilin Flp